MAEEKNKRPKIVVKKDSGKPEKKGGLPRFSMSWIYVLIAIILITMLYFPGGGENTLQTRELHDMLENKEVAKIEVVNGTKAYIYLTDSAKKSDKYTKEKRDKGFKKPMNPNAADYTIKQIPDYKSFKEDVALAQEGITKDKHIFIDSVEEQDYSFITNWVLFFALLFGFWYLMMRRMGGQAGGGAGQIFNIGKSKAQLFDKDTKVNVTFQDVAGLEEAKVEVMEIVDFLKNPKKYTDLGGKIPKGALLVGPPGTGKTLLAKAVAGEANVPFFSLSGSDFVEMFVGVGASRVRDLFKQAKEKAPCIIFIDEIDAIGRARGKNAMQGSNDERENTLNQLLTEMDGFGTDSGVIILAATNRVDVLDSALLRAGRFDRQIYADMPDLNERRAIFDVHLKPLKIEKNLDRDFLARQTPGFSGADIANMCNEAALIAARKNKKIIEKQDFLDAVDRIIGGLEKKNKIITPEEKRSVAVHEAGHATVSWLCEHASPLVKVTIVPRGRSLGAAWYLPEERQITTSEQILDEMCAALGGRAAEFVTFGKISTGALSDLEKVTRQAMAMVSIYGLNEKVGNISYYNMNEGFTKPFSEQTAALMDDEIKKLTDEQYQRAIKILTDNRDKLDQLADKLLEKEVIFKEDLESIFGKRPWEKEEQVIEVKEVKTEEKEVEAEDNVEAEADNTSEESTQDNSSTEETETTTEE
ncbi:MAG: ATP-dependent zinc metalloprotease FtsH [Bacteroidetes bacterium]|jgi:cell division protease FtsH|nr:ATP-dependent zinc metalloprotease FtsH [Bacteroidota bacterium]